MNRTIVAEITRNWGPSSGFESEIISSQFERVITHNQKLGYTLKSWKYAIVVHPGLKDPSKINVLETIIAVFDWVGVTFPGVD